MTDAFALHQPVYTPYGPAVVVAIEEGASESCRPNEAIQVNSGRYTVQLKNGDRIENYPGYLIRRVAG